jgi:hypothetical protein
MAAGAIVAAGPGVATPRAAAASRPVARPHQVDGIELVPITAAQRRQCQAVANQTHTPVPCPTLDFAPIPGSLTSSDCLVDGLLTCGALSIMASPPYFLAQQYNFQVPPGYVGVPGEISTSGGPLGHFIIYSGRPLDTRRIAIPHHPQPVPSYCSAVKEHRPITVHGSPAKMYQCSDNGDMRSVVLDAGHDLLVWRQDGVTCEVSLHGHSDVNQTLDVAVAQATTMVQPKRRT